VLTLPTVRKHGRMGGGSAPGRTTSPHSSSDTGHWGPHSLNFPQPHLNTRASKPKRVERERKTLLKPKKKARERRISTNNNKNKKLRKKVFPAAFRICLSGLNPFAIFRSVVVLYDAGAVVVSLRMSCVLHCFLVATATWAARVIVLCAVADGGVDGARRGGERGGGCSAGWAA
jgi:hypothetical protein